ncbi:fatty-acid peroxygenase [Streptosporangium becharense]|uniref:Fatty-acid peroxygenase n=1 Tax=Streptosporangium becharense TaxID=1816182 RepID=A0A7W9MJ66_9ACTN|nr:cytochrome P450 [Streptosporangium becharense]MBB2910184.1 fatty-acid peroxygenase [Streptosporangium becharense]MBB5822927.1 fatty-acid peroxygenase [Streptosporangium becharense]
MPDLDNTFLLLLEGYGWLPARRRRTPKEVVRTRVMGQRAVALCGPDAARFFYDEDHVERSTALPGPVKSTLFGDGAVHTLDGTAHRVRKAMFTSLMTDAGIAALVDATAAAWDKAAASWSGGHRVVLFDETARILTRAVCPWAGIPLDEDDVPDLAADLVAMVDGFATLGPRHWRARRARARREAWLGRLVEDVREGTVAAPPGSPLRVAARHRDADGELLDPRVAAVELLNVIRPTVAVTWFVTFAAHALHRWPRHRATLRDGDTAFAEAFTHEVRRFYPFAPFVGGRAVRDLSWRGEPIPAGALVLLDVYGQNHDPGLWENPYTFDPERFVGRDIGVFDLIPQGGGDPGTGHRCPGEAITVSLLRTLIPKLAGLDYDVPEQDLSISLRRVPARPASGFVLSAARPATTGRPAARLEPGAARS